MIQYDAHHWGDHLLDIKGSMVREIVGRVTLCLCWSGVVYGLYYWLKAHGITWKIPETAHSLIGGVLGLLLVFRTNASYDRFWEGRKLWGSMVNTTRNLARMAQVWLVEDSGRARRIIEWTIAFPWSVKHRLRGTQGLAPEPLDLPEDEVATVTGSAHPAVQVAHKLSQLIQQSKCDGLLGEVQAVAMEQTVQRLVDDLGGCERINNTPLPFAYMVHLRRALILYSFTLPLALVDRYDWGVIPITLIFTYIMFGIEEIGVEIESPFGADENDLPLDDLCASIQRTLRGMLDAPNQVE